MGLRAKIREFQSLQESRVREYKNLEAAFKVYLSSGPQNYDFPSFQEAVGEATKSFGEISEKMLQLKSSLEEKEPGIKAFRAGLEEVQRLEGIKLARTVEHQLLAQKAQDDPEDHVVYAKNKEVVKEIHGINGDINDALEEIRYVLADLEEE